MPIQVNNKTREGIIIINDFTGGLNTLLHPLLIQDNQTPTATNVWAPRGALTKRFGRMNFSTAVSGNSTSPIYRFHDIGQCTSSGLGGVLFNQSFVSGSAEYIIQAIMFDTISANGGSKYKFTTLLISTSSSPSASDYIVGGDINEGMLLIVPDSNSRKYIYSTSGVSSTSGGDTFPSPSISNANGYGFLATVTSSATSVTGNNVYLPITVLTSGTASHAANLSFTGTTALTTQDKHHFVVNLTPGRLNGEIIPSKVVTLSNKFYVTFMNPPTYLTAGVTGGGVEFSLDASVIDVYSVVSGTIVTAWPATFGQPIVHKNYIFIISSAEQDKIRFSSLGDGTSWGVNNFIRPRQGDSDDTLVKLIHYNGALIALSRRRMYAILGEVFDSSNPTFSVMEIETPNGFKYDYVDGAIIYNNSFNFSNPQGYYIRHPTILKIYTRYGLYTYSGGTKLEKQMDDENIRTLIEGNTRIIAPGGYGAPGYGGQTVGTTGDYISGFTFKDHLYINQTLINKGRNQYSLVKDYNGAWWSWNALASAMEFNCTNGTIYRNELLFSQPNRFSIYSTASIVQTAACSILQFTSSG